MNDYKGLAIAPTVFKVLAWVALSLGVISALIVFAGGGAPETPRMMGLVTLIVGGVYFFVLRIAAEAANLLLEINSKIK